MPIPSTFLMCKDPQPLRVGDLFCQQSEVSTMVAISMLLFSVVVPAVAAVPATVATTL